MNPKVLVYTVIYGLFVFSDARFLILYKELYYRHIYARVVVSSQMMFPVLALDLYGSGDVGMR